MASTYTDGLAVEIIGSGDKAGSWGDVTNNNLKALEEGISRYAEIGAAGSNTSTLNIPDGQTAYTDDSKGRSAVIKWTGAIASGDSHTVTLQVGGAEATQARFTAINGLSSSKDLVIDTASGTSLTIPNGYSANIHIDGSGNVINSLSGLVVEKIALKNNEIISNETNDEIIIAADTVKVGDDGAATLSSNGNQDLILKTGNTTTGSITLADGTNGDISITPHNTGKVVMDKVNIGGGEIDGTPIGANAANTGAFTTLAGTTSVTTPLVTNNAAMSITTTASNGDISITPNGSGEVNISKVDIDGGTISGTVITDSSIGSSSPSTGAFTTLSATGTSTLAAINASGNIATTGSASITSAAGLALSGAITGATTIGASGEITAGSVDTPDLHNAGTLDISTTGTNPLTIIANSALATIRGGTTAVEGNTVTLANNGNTAVDGLLSIGRQGGSTSDLEGVIVGPLRTSETVGITTTKMLIFGDTGTTAGQQFVFNVDTVNNAGTGVTPASLYRFTVGSTASSNNKLVIDSSGIDVTGDATASGSVITPTLTSTGALAINTASNGNLTVAPNGTGTVSISSGLDSTSATGGIGLSTSNSRIAFATTSSSYSKGLITFKAKDYGTDGTDGTDKFQFVLNQHGAYLHNDGGQYLNFTSGSGPTGNGIRGNGTSAIEIKSKVGTGGSSTIDNWGRAYHSGMVTGDGAFFKSAVNLGDASSGSLSTDFAGEEAHGLSTVPRILRAVLQCNNAGGDNGYAQNDEIDLMSLSTKDESSGSVQEGVSLGANATNVFVSTHDLANMQLAHKDGASVSTIDLARWDIYVYAWK